MKYIYETLLKGLYETYVKCVNSSLTVIIHLNYFHNGYTF